MLDDFVQKLTADLWSEHRQLLADLVKAPASEHDRRSGRIEAINATIQKVERLKRDFLVKAHQEDDAE